MRRRRLFAALTLSFLLFSSVATARGQSQAGAGEALPMTAAGIADLLGETCQRSREMAARIFDYTYTLETTERELDARGQVRRETVKVYEAYPARGRRTVLVLLSENGTPRRAEQVERERRRAANDLSAAEARQQANLNGANGERPAAAGTAAGGTSPCPFPLSRSSRELLRARYSLNWTDFLATQEFFAPRRALLHERETIVFSFRPRAGLQANDPAARVLAQLGGRIWLDAADRIIARLEAFPLAEAASGAEITMFPTEPRPDAPVTFAWTRLPNGTWLQSLFQFNSYGRENIFAGIGAARTSRLRDFRLFSTSVEAERLDAPRPQP